MVTFLRRWKTLKIRIRSITHVLPRTLWPREHKYCTLEAMEAHRHLKHGSLSLQQFAVIADTAPNQTKDRSLGRVDESFASFSSVCFFYASSTR